MFYLQVHVVLANSNNLMEAAGKPLQTPHATDECLLPGQDDYVYDVESDPPINYTDVEYRLFC